ncbi:MAG: DUF2619 domain-containing protein [Halanaerobiaceae bacterium]
MLKINSILLFMVFMRIISGIIELGAALTMYYSNNIRTAVKINALLGMIGPLILMLVTFLGIIELKEELSPVNIVLILTGVSLILIAAT